ncbi:MAG: HEPN domain-containing protein [Chloroflexi bacterium]|nr:HEPN domain-containing protein [Chloroflexota bacterium]
MDDPKDNYRVYMQYAQEMLDTADENFSNQRYRSACNRAYYGMFYAASALLFSKGQSYGKHSAVLAAFRKDFIKTGEFDKKWSDDYRLVMESRHAADYVLYEYLEMDDAVEMIAKAKEFVEEVKKWLQKRELL